MMTDVADQIKMFAILKAVIKPNNPLGAILCVHQGGRFKDITLGAHMSLLTFT